MSENEEKSKKFHIILSMKLKQMNPSKKLYINDWVKLYEEVNDEVEYAIKH